MSLRAAELKFGEVEVALRHAIASLRLDLERRNCRLSVHGDADLRLGRRVVANATPPHEGDRRAHGNVDAVGSIAGLRRVEVDHIRRESDGLNVLGRIAGVDAVIHVYLGSNRRSEAQSHEHHLGWRRHRATAVRDGRVATEPVLAVVRGAGVVVVAIDRGSNSAGTV